MLYNTNIILIEKNGVLEKMRKFSMCPIDIFGVSDYNYKS